MDKYLQLESRKLGQAIKIGFVLMFKTKEWIQACVAGFVFVLAYNLLYLHTSVVVAAIKSILVGCEANLILIIIFKVRELLNV